MKRFLVLPLLLSLAVTLLVGSPAQAATPVTVLTTAVAGFIPGQQAWISVLLKGGNAASCDVRVTGALTGVGISYPENTLSFTAPYRDYRLESNEIDFVALNVSVPGSMKTTQKLTLDVSYNTCDTKNNGSLNGNGNKNGHEGQEVDLPGSVILPVLPSLDLPLVQKTLTVGPIKAGDAQWVNVAFTGTAPDMSNFRFQITSADGGTVTYAKDAADSGLTLSPELKVLREDSVAVRINTAGMTKGVHVLKTKATYGASRTVQTGILTLVVS